MQRLDETPIEGPDTTEERKKQDRAGERARLEIGRPFRPYQLFDRVSVIPNLLRSYRGLTAGEKIAWMTLASFLGKEGDCYPSGATLGREMGVDRKQARRWVDGLVQKRFARKIPRPPESDSDDWSTNLYELLWHEVFQGEGCVGGDKSSPPPRDELPLPGGDKLSPRGGDRLPHKKDHHHQKEQYEKNHSSEKDGVAGCKSERKPARSVKYPNANQETSNASRKLADDDDEKKRPLENHEDEFRERLRERAWLNGPIEPEGIVQMVQAELKNNPSKWKRFLDYEAPLTTSQEVKTAGAHYRVLLKNFATAEENTRVEQQRAKREGGWHCPDAVDGCKNSLIENENGVPVRVCSCARHLPEKDREKRHSALREAALIYSPGG